MLAQPRSTITLRRLMDERVIVICNLVKGRLGEGPSSLGRAADDDDCAGGIVAREPGTRRPSTFLYADEFQSFATDSFALILSGARKYGLTLTVAHQYLDQLPDQLRAGVFGNVGSMLACRTGATDAPIIAEQIGPRRRRRIARLPNHAAWARLLADRVPTSPLRLNVYDAPLPRRPDAGRLIEISRRRFGRPRGEVERRIAAFCMADRDPPSPDL
jgi:hypothetical protein